MKTQFIFFSQKYTQMKINLWILDSISDTFYTYIFSQIVHTEPLIEYLCCLFAIHVSLQWSKATNRWMPEISNRISNHFDAVNWIRVGKLKNGITHRIQQDLVIQNQGYTFPHAVYESGCGPDEQRHLHTEFSRKRRIHNAKQNCPDAVWCMTSESFLPQIWDCTCKFDGPF